MSIYARLAAAVALTMVTVVPAFAQRSDNATIQGTESAPGNQGAPSAAEKFGNLVSTPFGSRPLPRADEDARGGPLPNRDINTNETSVFKTPGGPNSSDAR